MTGNFNYPNIPYALCRAVSLEGVALLKRFEYVMVKNLLPKLQGAKACVLPYLLENTSRAKTP